MTTSQPSGWFTGRTRLITIVSIVAVGLAGATAVSANIGILDAASNSNIGTVSASGDLTTPSTQVIDVYLPSTTGTPTTAVQTTAAQTSAARAAGVQEFSVDVAGTVAVASTDAGLRLDSVTPTAGWSWTLTQTSQTELMVTMTDGTRTLEFVAATTADGNIAANVNEPIVTPAPPAANGGTNTGTNTGGNYGDDEHEGEYEGGGDDD